MERISKEEFNDWCQHPVTEKVFEVLDEEQSALSQGLSQGAYMDDPKERLYMGYVRAIREVINKDNLMSELVEDEDE